LDLVQPRSWKDSGYRGFGPLIVAFSLFLLAWIAVAALTGALWVLGAALPAALTGPIWYYADARLKHRNLAKYGSLFIAVSLYNMMFTLFYRPPPAPLLAWFMVEFVSGVVLVIGISALLCERFLRPRLLSKT
jgi:glycerol uptake facilitator-like aquaporin